VTTNYKPWLPPCAMVDGKLLALFEKGWINWTSLWLADGYETSGEDFKIIQGCDNGTQGLKKFDRAWSSSDGKITVILPVSGFQILSTRLLGLKASPEYVSEADTGFFDHIINSSLTGLMEHICGVFLIGSIDIEKKLSPQYSLRSGRPLQTFSVMFGSDMVLRIGIETSTLVGPRRAGLENSPVYHEDMALSESIDMQKTSFKACLGASEISLHDLRALTLGDVIVFEKDVLGKVDLRVDECPLENTHGRIVQTGDILSLAFDRTNSENFYE
jgi:hypothetical protein